MTQKLIKGISHIKIQAVKGVDGLDGKNGKDAILPPTIDLRVPGVELMTLKGKRGEKGDPGPAGKDARGTDGRDGINGKDGRDGDKGNDGKDGKDGSPDTPDQVVEKVNSATKRIDTKRIKGLDEVIEQVSKYGSNPSGAAGGRTVRYLDGGTEPSAHVTELNFGTNLALTYDGNGRLTVDATGGGGSTFLTLTDTPSTYASQSLKGVRVNAGETALEFFTLGVGSGDVSKVGVPVNNQVGVWTGDGTLEGDVDLTFDTTTNTLATAIVTVTDDVYAVGWNGSTAVPTKNAVYDKIESLSAGSGIVRSVNSIAVNTNAGSTTATDYDYNCTAALTLTLPTAVGNTNTYEVTRIAGLTTVATTAAQTINGSATATLTINNMTLTFRSDGANWNIK